MIIAKIKKIELKNKDTDILVLTFDPMEYDFYMADQVFNTIKKEFPDNKIIGLVKGFELEVDNIDKLINKLQAMKEDNYNENIY